MNAKLVIRFASFILVMLLFYFQLVKRNNKLLLINEKDHQIEMANSPYVKVLSQLPVYRDTIYRIYIANIEGNNEIIFLKKDSISEVQKRSKFFFHVYPQNEAILIKSKTKMLTYDFKNNAKEFTYNKEKYYVSSAVLPSFHIKKINVGQYAFNGNSKINWRVNKIITSQKVLEKMQMNDIKMIDLFHK